MQITELSKHISKLPKPLKSPILAIIELQTNNNMQEVKKHLQILTWVIGMAFTVITVLLVIIAFSK